MTQSHQSTHWALKITAATGADLKRAIEAASYKLPKLLEVGPVAKVQLLEIMDVETGQKATFLFTGVGAGLGVGIVSTPLDHEWAPFNTKKPLNLEDFKNKLSIAYNASIGVGAFGYAPISAIRFTGIDIIHNSKWEHFWLGNGIDLHGVTFGTQLDVSYVPGILIEINHTEPDANLLMHFDEINHMCIDDNSADLNISLPDTATVHHGADSNQIDHPQQSYLTDANMSLPDGVTVHHGADSNQTDPSQQTHSTDSNMSLPDGAIVYLGADSNQIDHSQQAHSTDDNLSLPDGATVHYGADSNQTDHLEQTHSTDHSSSNQTDSHQNQIEQHVAHDDGSQSMHP